jgi:drug/metabolite transporter (DMT)-like permease
MVSSKSILFLVASSITFVIFQAANKQAIRLGADPLGITLLGLAGGALVTLAYMLATGKVRLKLGTAGRGDLLAAAFFSSAITQLFIIFGLGRAALTNANIIIATNAVFGAVVSGFINKERLTTKFWLVSAVMLAGTVLVSIRGSFALPNIGDVAILVGTASLGTGIAFSKKAMKNFTDEEITLARFVVGFLFLLIPAILWSNVPALLGKADIVALVAVGSVVYPATIILFYKAVEVEGAAISSQGFLLNPFTALAFDVLFFQTLPQAMQIAGGALVLAGGYALVMLNRSGELFLKPAPVSRK